MLLQSRVAECGLTILDVGGADDCLFRAVCHQLYGGQQKPDVDDFYRKHILLRKKLKSWEAEWSGESRRM